MGRQGKALFETRLIDDRVDYDGSQLRSHFIRHLTGLGTDGLVSFTGACDVRGERLVDLEDREREDFIVASEMLHFIGEHFSVGLREGNALLRILVCIARESIEEANRDIVVIRRGDDLFVDQRKLSVAICTVSPTSALFHLGINIDPEGAPVPAIGLGDLGIDPNALAGEVLDRYHAEIDSLEIAIRKVRGVD